MPRLVAVVTVTLAAFAVAPALLAEHPPSDRRGLVFAEQHCAGCHAVHPDLPSPDPEAPSFDTIANRPGVTHATLRRFLRDSHNYPETMNFQVDARRIRDLADYIVTLQKPGYRPIM